MKTVYRLKPLVFTRLVTEVCILLGCGILPLVGTFTGFFSKFSSWAQWGALGVCLGAWTLLPVYGFITWSVEADDLGITVRSFYKKCFCAWQEVKSLTLRSSWNISHYAVATTEGDELSFPTWLNNYEALVRQIREKLPVGSGRGASSRSFHNSSFTLLTQVLQCAFGLVLAGTFWLFVYQVKLTNIFDTILVIGFTGLLSAIFVWRTVMVAWMPMEVETSDSHIALKSAFYNLQLPWNQVIQLIASSPLLPEGYILKTKRGDFLIAGAIEASDELANQIEENCRLTQSSSGS